MVDPNIAPQVEHMLDVFARHCGIELQDLSGDTCTLTVQLKPEHLNLYGFVHGGMINTIMANAGGIVAAFAHGPVRPVVTGSADAHFLRPVCGSTMKCVATLVKAGRTMARVQLGVYDENDKLCTVGFNEYVYTDNR